jgi:UDP-N-acetylmuramoyl-tripeptide--D-alanyl-D-alanine ligase
MRAAFHVLREIPTQGRRIAVLGDMLELGDFAPAAHRTVGTQAAAVSDVILAYGPLSRELADAAGEKASHFDTREDLLKALRELAKPGDVLLFKASHGMHLEQVLEHFFA